MFFKRYKRHSLNLEWWFTRRFHLHLKLFWQTAAASCNNCATWHFSEGTFSQIFGHVHLRKLSSRSFLSITLCFWISNVLSTFSISFPKIRIRRNFTFDDRFAKLKECFGRKAFYSFGICGQRSTILFSFLWRTWSQFTSFEGKLLARVKEHRAGEFRERSTNSRYPKGKKS